MTDKLDIYKSMVLQELSPTELNVYDWACDYVQTTALEDAKYYKMFGENEDRLKAISERVNRTISLPEPWPYSYEEIDSVFSKAMEIASRAECEEAYKNNQIILINFGSVVLEDGQQLLKGWWNDWT